MHEHHHESCSHNHLKYCAHCDVVYCVACRREWGSRRWWYIGTYPYWTGTYWINNISNDAGGYTVNYSDTNGTEYKKSFSAADLPVGEKIIVHDHN